MINIDTSLCLPNLSAKLSKRQCPQREHSMENTLYTVACIIKLCILSKLYSPHNACIDGALTVIPSSLDLPVSHRSFQQAVQNPSRSNALSQEASNQLGNLEILDSKNMDIWECGNLKIQESGNPGICKPKGFPKIHIPEMRILCPKNVVAGPYLEGKHGALEILYGTAWHGKS